MKTAHKRILTFLIGFPIVLLFVFVPYYNHLALHFLLLFFAFVGSLEFCKMAKNKFEIFPTPLITAYVVLIWFSNLIFCNFNISFEYLLWVLSAEIISFFGIESFTAKTFENSLSKISVSSLIIIYVGFLSTFITRLSTLDNETVKIMLYFIYVFMCDSLAWVFGILFGKNNRGLIAASPNKSLVGFIGGILGSMLCGFLFTLCFPEVFTVAVWKILLTGFLTSVAGIIGDLVESVFKRSTNVKDSGWIIPGRGGSLDCLDSLIIAAPVYYACALLLY